MVDTDLSTGPPNVNGDEAAAPTGHVVDATSPSTMALPPAAQDSLSREEISARILEQARIIHSWHLARSDSMTTRAGVQLGATGLLIPLLLTGATVDGFDADPLTWVLLGLSLGGALLAVFFCLVALAPRTIDYPSVGDIRALAAKHQSGQPLLDGGPSAQLVENLLLASDLTETSSLNRASDHANARARWVTWAGVALAAAITATAFLVLDVLIEAW